MPNFIKTCVACHKLLERKVNEGPRQFMFRRFCDRTCARKIAPFNKKNQYDRDDLVRMNDLERERAQKLSEDYKFDETFG